jgi:hypothetical protein
LQSATSRVSTEPLTTPQPVQILANSIRICGLSIERPSIVAYLHKIAPEKVEIALVHAIEVGIVEMQVRREPLPR